MYHNISGSNKQRITNYMEMNLLIGPQEICNFLYFVLKIISVFDNQGIFSEISLIWLSPDLTDNESMLMIQNWCCLTAPSHYLSQCCPDLCHHMASLGHNDLMTLHVDKILCCQTASVGHDGLIT